MPDMEVLLCSLLCQWLADQARSLNIDLWTSCTAIGTRYDGHGTVVGVTVMRKDQDAEQAHSTDVHARTVLFAEGTRGILSEVCTTCLVALARCV
jgi:flavin-dependent dehydrogenase